jgi:thiamine-monophosphate kinase
MAKKKQVTPLSELGEFGLIQHLTRDIKIQDKTTILGVGDDAAILDYKGKKVVLTTDMLVEGIHFDLVYTPLQHLGYKSVVVNLSDIYAMNAFPGQITVSIAVSAKFSVEAIDELYKGIKLACSQYGVDLIGGDTTSSMSGLIISVTAVGRPKGEIVRRNGAKKNDIICVSGNLGAAYMGLHVLQREKSVFEESSGVQPGLEGYEYVLQRFLKPEARKDIIELLQQQKVVPTSMIDISDGLSSELFHICKSSGAGCKIFQEKIPVDVETAATAKEFAIQPEICALNGGEDYELLFTISIADYEKIKDIKDIHMIGHITSEEDGLQLITKQGASVALQAQGWNPLQND